MSGHLISGEQLPVAISGISYPTAASMVWELMARLKAATSLASSADGAFLCSPATYAGSSKT